MALCFWYSVDFCVSYIQTNSSKQRSENRHILLPHAVYKAAICYIIYVHIYIYICIYTLVLYTYQTKFDKYPIRKTCVAINHKYNLEIHC